jgi:hypothetical protein
MTHIHSTAILGTFKGSMGHLLLLEIVSNAILGIYGSFTMFCELWGGSLLFIYSSSGKAKAEIREK